jgi:hypothetical protein
MRKEYKKPFVLYKNQQNRNDAFYLLLSEAIRLFKNAYIIKKFSEVREFINTLEMQRRINHFDLHTFSREQLIDKIKIVICLENCMKAILIKKGYIVHLIDRTIDNGKFRNLKIRKRPIRFVDYKRIEGYHFDSINQKYVLRGMCETTLPVSVLLLPNYQNILRLPVDILTTLKKLINDRNKIHLSFHSVPKISINYINGIESSIQFINLRIIKRYHLDKKGIYVIPF